MIRRRAEWGIFMVTGALALLAPALAAADWDPGPQLKYSYEITSDGSSGKVYVHCPRRYEGSSTTQSWFNQVTCKSLGGVVRENLKTGEVVALPCYADPKSKAPTVTMDSCVPPGTYLYGTRQPMGCGEPYYGTVTVSSMPTGCAREADAPATASHSGGAPWHGSSGNNHICEEGGCSTSRARVNGVIFGAQALALALGFALFLWRRRSRG